MNPTWSWSREMSTHSFFDGTFTWGQVLFSHRGPVENPIQEKPYHAYTPCGEADFSNLRDAKRWVESEHARMTGFLSRRPL